jgi:magnesium-transporting ATPase (P-type)
MNNNENAGKACSEKENKFKWRSFVSMTIFVFIIILVATGTAIQIIESLSENYETVENIPSYMASMLHSVIAIHILVGFSFGILSTVHIVLNWKSLKNYFGKKTSRINKEVVFALALPMFLIVIGIIVALIAF